MRFVEIDGFGRLPPSLEICDRTQINLTVALQPYPLSDSTHYETERKITSILRKHKITSKLFSYCTHSYGIEYPDEAENPQVMVHFSAHLRTDKYLHPHDRLHTLNQ